MRGAFAELVRVPVGSAVAKPDELTFEQTAALPLAGTTALTLLRTCGVGPGSSLLVIGASGGVGTYTVQLAKARGVEVTAVCSTRNVEKARHRPLICVRLVLVST
ncbi:hypothetical protein [Pseudonocardia sp. WMMC193]|uniref:hypothetical protein n=1 Tax=Pseudonocardia sp. WMMC193 TaxID=2911965 RepID=UPI001F1CA469|nr:hypothetical protein [Pseudonocardia sp. WMMC193]MCF7550697.1 hypothetical protein [Pseudonocardia sp. WMMC193]